LAREQCALMVRPDKGEAVELNVGAVEKLVLDLATRPDNGSRPSGIISKRRSIGESPR